MRPVAELKAELYEQMERTRAADLSGMDPHSAFLFGYLSVGLAQALEHIESIEERLDSLERHPIQLGPF